MTSYYWLDVTIYIGIGIVSFALSLWACLYSIGRYRGRNLYLTKYFSTIDDNPPRSIGSLGSLLDRSDVIVDLSIDSDGYLPVGSIQSLRKARYVRVSAGGGVSLAGGSSRGTRSPANSGRYLSLWSSSQDTVTRLRAHELNAMPYIDADTSSAGRLGSRPLVQRSLSSSPDFSDFVRGLNVGSNRGSFAGGSSSSEGSSRAGHERAASTRRRGGVVTTDGAEIYAEIDGLMNGWLAGVVRDERAAPTPGQLASVRAMIRRLNIRSRDIRAKYEYKVKRRRDAAIEMSDMEKNRYETVRMKEMLNTLTARQTRGRGSDAGRGIDTGRRNTVHDIPLESFNRDDKSGKNRKQLERLTRVRR